MTKQSKQQTGAGHRKTMASLVKPGRKDVIERTENAEWRVVAAGLSEHEATWLAAAPDMLEALQAIEAWVAEVPSPYREFPFVVKARAAIAKAQGAQP